MQIIFDNYPQIIAGLSECSDGSMVWWNRLPVDEAIRKNRDRYFSQQSDAACPELAEGRLLRGKIDPQKVVAGGIVYGTNVAVVTEAEAGKYLLNTDALVTNVPDIFLSVTAADCLPVYFCDPVTKSCGIAHASWHGLLGGILENVVKKMQGSFSSRPENIQVFIGPHIKSCHYEVGPEVAAKFAPQNIIKRGGRLFADLGAEAVGRLRNFGVKDIIISQECTYDNPQKFYSARRDKSESLQGMVAYIGFK
jgi:polyphenol oxidase